MLKAAETYHVLSPRNHRTRKGVHALDHTLDTMPMPGAQAGHQTCITGSL